MDEPRPKEAVQPSGFHKSRNVHRISFAPNCICRDEVEVAVITPAVGDTPVAADNGMYAVWKDDSGFF